MNEQPLYTIGLLASLQIPIFSIHTLPACAVFKTENVGISLHHCTSIAQSIQPSNAPELLQRGRELYQAQQFSSSVRVLEQAAQGFKNQGDELNQALALNYLSLANQKLGQWTGAQKAIAESLQILKSNSFRGNSKDYLSIIAQAYNTQGQFQIAIGKPEEAFASWELAKNAYTKIGNETGIIGSQINQAQALQDLGQYHQASITLKKVNNKIQKQPDSLLKANSWLSLGNALRVVGDLDQKDPKVTQIDSLGSRQILEQSLAIAERLKEPETIAQVQLSLGNTLQALINYDQALDYYKKAAVSSPSPITQVQAELNQLNLLVKRGQGSDIQDLWPQIYSQFDKLSLSQETVYARINFAQSLIKLGKSSPLRTLALNLATAVRDAKTLGDPRAEAYAQGTLGEVYEQTQQWKEAQELTQQAVIKAQEIQAPDIVYRFEWQLGRLLKAQGNIAGAIAADSEAVQTLKFLRNDLVALHRDVQFSFRDDVEPIYRDLVELLLSSEKPTQENLKQARETIEALQLAELDNFFRDACLQAKPTQIDEIINKSDSTTAAIYPIILPSKLAVIVKLPQTPDLYYYSTKIENKDVDKILKDLLQELKDDHPTQNGRNLSQQVYGWLLQKAETKFKNKGVNNLVFVLDGFLRNIPMAVLYDGNDYILKKYGITIAPGLQLVKTKPLTEQSFKVLAAGVSLEQKIDNNLYPRLENVETEIKQIGEKFKANILLNQNFTIDNFTKQIGSNSFSVVHIATHGEFGSTPEQTYIVAWGKLITAAKLNEILQISSEKGSNNIELLILTACETAKGDGRATLGLAGLAVRSGARSTLASLWRLDDASSVTLVNEFYKQLKSNPKVTKAEALRQAQIQLLSKPNSHAPYKWAPYILVGNWQ